MKQITQRKNRNRIIASLLFTLFLITGIILFLSRTKEDFGRQPTTSVLYKLSDIYTAGSIFDRNQDRKSTRLNSSHVSISYAVFCLKKKKYKTEEAISQ